MERILRCMWMSFFALGAGHGLLVPATWWKFEFEILTCDTLSVTQNWLPTDLWMSERNFISVPACFLRSFFWTRNRAVGSQEKMCNLTKNVPCDLLVVRFLAATSDHVDTPFSTSGSCFSEGFWTRRQRQWPNWPGNLFSATRTCQYLF